jgi:hypothetical protein
MQVLTITGGPRRARPLAALAAVAATLAAGAPAQAAALPGTVTSTQADGMIYRASADTTRTPRRRPASPPRLTRRVAGLLRRAAAASAAPSAAPASAGPAAASGAPGARARLAPPATVARTTHRLAGAVRPGVAIDFVGVQWRGAAAGAGVRLRRAGRWGAWRPLAPGEVHAPGRHASELVAAHGATAYQVRLPEGAREGSATAINTTDGPRRSRPAARAATSRSLGMPSRLCFRARADWGADESLRFDAAGDEIWVPAYFPVQKLTLHHTATEGAGVDPAATVRAIYRYHAVDLGFGDIGYHLLIDEHGCVYEGRHSGAGPLPVYGPSAADGTRQAVNAGHVLGFNAGNVGVAILGDFTDHEPTARARAGAVRALAAVARLSGLDPLGSGTYVNPITGATRDVATISGHLDWLATECPGAMFYPLLPAIREQVARLTGVRHQTG